MVLLVFFNSLSDFGKKKMSVQKILHFTLTSFCEQGNRPILIILSLCKLQPLVFVSATVSSPKWKQTPQFLQFHFFLSTCDSYVNGSTHCQGAYLRGRVRLDTNTVTKNKKDKE
jgi:hypothetical protein